MSRHNMRNKSCSQIVQERETYELKAAEAFQRLEQQVKSMDENRKLLTQQYQNERQQMVREMDANQIPQGENPRIQQVQLLEQQVDDANEQCSMMDSQMHMLRSTHRELLRRFKRELAKAELMEQQANVNAFAALSIQPVQPIQPEDTVMQE
ncbi:hypothetical protein SBOR_6764 [Sclerotinia borealis F-4128]|uniref:Uncharacterized protein n=1 Tax=Sclerotinia borealis (strain F-4128) TaxID=1432307 RepID=W9CAJ2_SCLBF|nr:hypothetical protein SBOR_6764 [Sclerotinia borealis F-4128]